MLLARGAGARGRWPLRLAFAALGLAALLLLGTPTASAATRCVGTSDGCDSQHGSVREALDAAAPGDTVLVGPGTYREVVDIAKPLTLRSTEPRAAMLDATGLMDWTLRARAPEVTVEGFTIRHGGGNTMVVDAAGTAGFTFRGNAVESGGDPEAVDPIRDLEAGRFGHGLVLDFATRPVVEGNGFTWVPVNHQAGDLEAHGILAPGLREARIAGNTFRGWIGFGVLLSGSTGNLLDGNRFESGCGGVLLRDSAGSRLQGNVFAAVLCEGVTLQGASGGTVLRRNFLGAPIPLLVEGIGDAGVDARANDWGVYDWQLVMKRPLDLESADRVRVIPFLLPTGELDPGLVHLLGASCGARTAEPPETPCGFLSIGDALAFAAPGSTVVVEGSRNPADPAPRVEGVVMEVEGVTLCAAPAGEQRCSPSPSTAIIEPLHLAVGAEARAVVVRASNVTVEGFTLRALGAQGRVVDARGAVGLTLRRNVIEGAQELRPDQLQAAGSPFAPTADTRAFFEHPFVRDTLASRAYADLAARARGAPGFLAAVPLLEPAPHVGLLFTGPVASGLLEGLPAGPPVQAYANVGLLPLVEPVSPEERSRIAASAEASAMAGPHGPATPSPENGIGPGTRIVGSGGCTANFVFTDGAGNAYLGTAGHCVLGGADEARDFDPGVFACVARCGPGGGVWVRLGPVLYARQNGPEGPLGNDFAWVLIPRELHHLVRPWMWLWGGPTGVAGAIEPVPGQPLVHYGHGFLIGALFPTRGRAALSVAGPVGDEPVVVEDEPVVGPFYSAVGDVAPGDSGSPIATAGRASRLLVGDKAMGDITHGVVLPFVLQAPFFVGTTVERALRFLEEETGVRLEVRVEDRPLVEPFTLGVDLAGSRGARLEHNLLHMAGGGCRPGDGACADPPVSAVAAGAMASGATLARNRIVADAASGLLDQRGPVLGGTRGVDGSFEGSSIGGNVLRQWAGGAVVLRAGGGNVVEDNLLDHNGAGVVLCSSAGNEVLRNTFLAHDAAVLLCGASEANVLTRNSLGPTNAAGLALAIDTASLRVDARLNCWGAQTLSGVRSRVRDEGVGNAVEVVPFLDADCATPILPPVAGLAAAPNPADRVSPVQFRDTSEPGGRPIAARLWEFGDGSTGTEAAPQHTYTQLGTFTARLTVTNAAELSAAAQLAMRVVNVPPLAAFGSAPEPSNRVDPTQFGDASADRDGSIVGYLWDLGDGATSTERDPQHTYAQLGTHPVTLTVTDNDGAEATATRAVEVVNLPPSVDFTFSPAHPMVLAPVRFHGHGSDRDGEVAAWSWDLGNGLASDAQDPVTVYTQGGFHGVTLTVTDDDGGVASVTRAVFVCAPGVDLQALVGAGRVRVELQGCIALSAPPLAGAAPPWLLGGAGGEPRALASAAYAPTRP